MSMKLVTSQPDIREDRGFLPTGDDYADEFNCARPSPVNSSYLEQSTLRLQAVIARRHQHKKVEYVSFLRRELSSYHYCTTVNERTPVCSWKD